MSYLPCSDETTCKKGACQTPISRGIAMEQPGAHGDGLDDRVVPGAIRSGLYRPSAVGPMEEKKAMLSYLAAHAGLVRW